MENSLLSHPGHVRCLLELQTTQISVRENMTNHHNRKGLKHINLQITHEQFWII